MTTDNRTNEPTEAQIEHVRDQLEAKWPEMVCYWHPHRDDEERQHEWETIETWDIAEAALVAAQEAAPVLPSSGVDEDALVEVVCLALNHRDGGEECEDDYRVARAVAAWLEGQGGESRGE